MFSRLGDFRLGLVIATVLAALFVLFGRASLPSRLEAPTIDARFELRGPVAADDDIVLILIDDRSIAELGRWPWSRTLLADVVRRLDRAGARVIAIDLLFTEQDRTSVPYRIGTADDDLADAIAGSGRVVLPVYFAFDDAAVPAGPRISAAVAHAAYRTFHGLDTQWSARIPTAAFAIASVTPLADAAAALGHVNLLPDADGRARLEPLAIRFADRFLPALPVAVARLASGLRAEEVRLEFGSGVRIGPRFVPTDLEMRTPVNHRGPAGTFGSHAFSAVWRGEVDDHAFADRIVLIGATATGIGGLFAGPFGPVSGVERYAAVIDGILNGDTLLGGSALVLIDVAVILGLGTITAWLFSRIGPLRGGVAALLALLLTLVAIQAAFAKLNLVLNVTFPVVTMIAVATMTSIGGYARTQREGRRIRDAFAHYLHPAVVERLARHPASLRLGGEQRTLTVLFSDIRGFTGLAERLPPDRLIGFMNAYLEAMTRQVLAHRGLLDKYIGDGILAVYGAPLASPDHALDACRTALAMVDTVGREDAIWRHWGAEGVRIGVGINTGPMVIGNIGSAQRFEYTVLGDEVNLGARIEQETKRHAVDIIVSEATWLLVRDRMDCRDLGFVRVRGRRRAVRLFALIGEKPNTPAAATSGISNSEADGRSSVRRAEGTCPPPGPCVSRRSRSGG